MFEVITEQSLFSDGSPGWLKVELHPSLSLLVIQTARVLSVFLPNVFRHTQEFREYPCTQHLDFRVGTDAFALSQVCLAIISLSHLVHFKVNCSFQISFTCIF